MQYKTISYKRIKNLGNYQSETVEMSAELDDDDNVDFSFEKLKVTVSKALDIDKKTEDKLDEIPY